MEKKKPIIGIVGRPDMASDDDVVICVGEFYRRALVKKGAVPILILPMQDIAYESIRPKDMLLCTEEEKDSLKQVIELCDGILMPGGYKWYEYDEYICRYALKHDIPLLSICMGMQLLGRVDQRNCGVTGYTNEKNDTNIEHKQKGVQYAHKVNVKEDTLLYKIVGKKELKVNSKHSYHLIDGPSSLTVSAYSEDGLIEALESENHSFVLGVQWHPEVMSFYDECADKIIGAFVEACKKRS